ncbi:hypothetical protein EON64_05930, partial [archaeon]
MEVSADEHPAETALKLQLMRIYNSKLAERARRKRFVLERGLLDLRGAQAKEKRLSKEERELVARFRPFARFLSPEDYETLLEGCLKAHRLQLQIGMYKAYRALGLTSLEDIEGFERERRQEALTARMRRQSADGTRRGA